MNSLLHHLISHWLLFVSFMTSSKTVRFLLEWYSILFGWQTGRNIKNHNLPSLGTCRFGMRFRIIYRIQNQSTVKLQVCVPIHTLCCSKYKIQMKHEWHLVEHIPPPGWTVYISYPTDRPDLHPDLQQNRIGLFLSTYLVIHPTYPPNFIRIHA